MATLDQLTEQAQSLSPVERLKLVEAILDRLEPADPVAEKRWGIEGDARYEAYRRGELEALDWESVRDELGR